MFGCFFYSLFRWLFCLDVSPRDFAHIEEERETRGRGFRFRRYDAESGILIITIPTRLHEQMHAELYRRFEHLLSQRRLEEQWMPFAATRLPAGHDLARGASEGDSSGGPYPERCEEGNWPTLVIEAGVSQSLRSLRTQMRWWFSASSHDVKIVILVKFHRTRDEIALEKWVEEPSSSRPGATTTRWSGTLRPVLQQLITLTRDLTTDPVSYNVASDTLLLEFRLLFLRDPRPEEGGDIVFTVSDLERFAERAWAIIGHSIPA